MDRAEIKTWVADNDKCLSSEPLTFDEIAHVAMCLEHIQQWYYEGYPLGDFLTAVVRNDFRLACVKADEVNRKALYLYALFMYNYMPADYDAKAGLMR